MVINLAKNRKTLAQRAIGFIWVLVAVWVIICGIWVLVWVWRLAQLPPRELPDEDRQAQNPEPNRYAPRPPTNYFKVEDI